jgi:hypothetical protein
VFLASKRCMWAGLPPLDLNSGVAQAFIADRVRDVVYGSRVLASFRAWISEKSGFRIVSW